MKAIWYDKFGGSDVLMLGDMPDPIAGPGEVLVRVKATGINPSDVKRRAGARPGASMDFAQVIPHSDGAGVIEAVGAGVDLARLGQRVWLWNAAWQRAFGTAAELVALPSHQAVDMADHVTYEDAACFGIPAMTAWYALFGQGPIEGKTVLVTGGAGTVGRYACQMAQLGGARVITTVSSAEKGAHSTADDWINYRNVDVADAVMELTDGAGLDLIVDVDFAANQMVAVKALKPNGTVAAYASASEMTPKLQFYPLMFQDVTLRMLIAYLITPEIHRAGEAQLAKWLDAGSLSHAPVVMEGLGQVHAAHDLVASGEKLGTVVVRL